ncbi:MAG: 4Fe-4S dicluster domain-containing protein [Candidatus Thorarchaeota archaeon]
MVNKMTTVTAVSDSGRTDFTYDPSKCNRCGNCIEVCAFNVWELPEQGPAIFARSEGLHELYCMCQKLSW